MGEREFPDAATTRQSIEITNPAAEPITGDLAPGAAENAIDSVMNAELGFLSLQIGDNTVFMPSLPPDHVFSPAEEDDIMTAVSHGKDTPNILGDQIRDRLKRLHYPETPEINQMLISQTGEKTFSVYSTYRGKENHYYLMKWINGSTCELILNKISFISEEKIEEENNSKDSILMLQGTEYAVIDQQRDDDYQHAGIFTHSEYDEVM